MTVYLVGGGNDSATRGWRQCHLGVEAVTVPPVGGGSDSATCGWRQ